MAVDGVRSLTRGEVAEMAGIDRSTVTRWVSLGKLPQPLERGKYCAEDVESLLAASGQRHGVSPTAIIRRMAKASRATARALKAEALAEVRRRRATKVKRRSYHTAELLKRYGISNQTLSRWVAAGKLPAPYAQGKFDAEAVEAAEAAHRLLDAVVTKRELADCYGVEPASVTRWERAGKLPKRFAPGKWWKSDINSHQRDASLLIDPTRTRSIPRVLLTKAKNTVPHPKVKDFAERLLATRHYQCGLEQAFAHELLALFDIRTRYQSPELDPLRPVEYGQPYGSGLFITPQMRDHAREIERKFREAEGDRWDDFDRWRIEQLRPELDRIRAERSRRLRLQGGGGAAKMTRPR